MKDTQVCIYFFTGMLKTIAVNIEHRHSLGFVFILMLIKEIKSEVLQVEVCPESVAALPCPALASTDDDDRSLAAFWYKDDQVTPFYMVDGRTSVSIDHGRHRQLSALGKRAQFNVTSMPALLYLEVHSKEDAGLYACRVDWYRSLTRTSMVKLKVLALTPKLIIYEGEKELPEVAGPYSEGSDLQLACELIGGDLGPMLVIWMIHNTVIDSTFDVLPNGKTRNEHVLRGLKRSLWMVPVTCVATKDLNSTNDPALARAVQLDLFLRPLGVKITPNHGLCKEGWVVDFRCRAWGSRPAADITWWMKNFRLYNVTGRSVDRDTSTNSLSLIPLASDHGNIITCRAENPKLPGRVLVDNITLNVTFPPKVSLSLKTYSSSTLSEGDTVALICRVISNPLALPVQWSFVRESSVSPKQENFPKSGTHTLVLERLEPWHKGSYRCRATNSEGSGESNALWLAVRHRPICRAGLKVSYGAHLGETLSIRCEVEAEPAVVSFHWSFANTLVHHSNVSFVSRSLKSIATYTPTKDLHLGSLFCWANNSAGEQHVPCTFIVFRPSKPNPPKNCQSLNRTQSSFVVSCEPSYDGGSIQQFHFKAKMKDSPNREVTLSAPIPVFTLMNLPPGSTFEVIIISVNRIGKSKEIRLETATLQGTEKEQWPSKTNRGFLISSLLILFFATLTLVAAAVLRHRSHPFRL